MNENTKRVLAFVLVALAGALVGALVMWGVGRAGETGPDADSERLAELEAQVESLAAEVRLREASITALQQALAEASASGDTASGGTDGAGRDTGDDSGSAGGSSATERQFCFITEAVWDTGAPQITVDYAQLLTGEAARDAAIAAGEEPLDWYVLNENPRLRTFPADPSKQVTLVTKSDGSIDTSGYTVGFGQWFDWFTGASGGPTDQLQAAAYYVTIADGTIVKIEEVYFP